MSLTIKHEGDVDLGNQKDKVEAFEVVLEHSHNGTYHPGQYVEGHVLVHLNRSMLTRGITIQFCGQSDIYWTETRRGRATKCIETVEFDAHEEFYNIKNYIHEPGVLNAGVNKFPFKFHLVPPLPENFADNLCRIEHFIEARLKQDTNTVKDLKDRKEIWISDPTDLNNLVLPDVKFPVLMQKTKTFCCWCCVSQPVVGFLRLVRSGYCPGQTIHVQADVENNSSRHISDVKFTLYEEREYITKYKTHTHRDIIISVSKGPVPSRKTKEWPNIPLTIPKYQLFNVSTSSIFGIRHILEMEVIPRGISKKMVLQADIVLGPIPLAQTSLQAPTHSRPHPNKEGENISEFQRRISNPGNENISFVYTHNAPFEVGQDVKPRTNNSNITPSKVFKRKDAQTEDDTIRQRRKDRNRRVYPDDVIDSRDYSEKVVYRENEKLPPFKHFDG